MEERKWANDACRVSPSSLHLGVQKILAVRLAVVATFFDGLGEVLALLRNDYQGLFVFAKGADLLALRRDVVLFEGAVTQTLPVENPREEAAPQNTPMLEMEDCADLPFLLAFICLFFFLHNGGVGLLRVRLTARILHVNAEDVDRVVVRGGSDEARHPAELQIVDLCFVSAAAEHKWTRGIGSIHFPDADESSFLRSRGQEVAVAVEGHGCNGALVAHDDGFDAALREGPHLDVALLRVRDGEHAGALAVERAQSVRVVAGVEAVDEGEVGEVVDVGFHGEDDDDAVQGGSQQSGRKKKPPGGDRLTHPCVA